MTPQVGDKVVISSAYSKRLDTITKVTKTQVTVSDGLRFVIRTGRAVGDNSSWNRRYFHVVTPLVAEDLRQSWEEDKQKAERVRYLSKYEWETRELGTLNKVLDILDTQ